MIPGTFMNPSLVLVEYLLSPWACANLQSLVSNHPECLPADIAAVSARSVADSEALPDVLRVLQLIDQSDGIVLERNAAAVIVNKELVSA